MEIAFPVPEDKKYELLNLQPQSWYQLYMRAVSTSGTSDPSEVLTITTQAKHSQHQQGKQQQFKGSGESLVNFKPLFQFYPNLLLVTNCAL